MKITEVLTVTEFSVATVAVAFVILVIFLIITSVKIKKSVENAQLDFHRVSIELSSLISKANELSTDIKNKSDVFFDAFNSSNQSHPNDAEESADSKPKVPIKLIGWVISSLLLARKTKNLIKKLW